MKSIEIFDTTLRDGNQGLGVGFTVLDKLEILQTIDRLRFAEYVEGGWPGSNPKDMEFFKEASKMSLNYARLVVFGSTKRYDTICENDPSLQSCVNSGASVATIFGKSWDRHVRNQLGVSLETGLQLIEESVRYLVGHPNMDQVIYDAEHFFDGFLANKDFAMASIKRAIEAGAGTVVLCETNGGMSPTQVRQITRYVKKTLKSYAPDVTLGIHCHNDGDLATANTLEAVLAGARHVQGTINGFGERSGNADLIPVIAHLQVKGGYSCIPEESLALLTHLSRKIYDLANVLPDPRQAIVGWSSAAHKSGVHADAITKDRLAYQAWPLERFGNTPRIVVSDQSGKANISYMVKKLGLEGVVKEEHIKPILGRVKEQENQGYSFEAADDSLKLIMLESAGVFERHFVFEGGAVITVLPYDYERQKTGRAIVKSSVAFRVGKESEIFPLRPGVGELRVREKEREGDFVALESAVKSALQTPIEELNDVRLLEYKLITLPARSGDVNKFRALARFSHDGKIITTVGVAKTMLEANLNALLDSYESVLYDVGYGRAATPIAAHQQKI